MVEVRQTVRYAGWFARLRDVRAQDRIIARVRRLSLGNPGDTKNLKGGVYEMRIDHGPGYRVYFTRRGNMIVLLLCGGDKSTQTADIAEAKSLAAEIKEFDDGA